jgi:hypothetical protein
MKTNTTSILDAISAIRLINVSLRVPKRIYIKLGHEAEAYSTVSQNVWHRRNLFCLRIFWILHIKNVHNTLKRRELFYGL